MTSQPLTLILTHENADFDAVASQLGAWLLEPSAVPVLPRRCNRNVRAFLSIYADELPFVEATDLPRRAVNQVVLVDTQGLVTAKGVTPSTLVHILDHHPPCARAAPELDVSRQPGRRDDDAARRGIDDAPQHAHARAGHAAPAGHL